MKISNINEFKRSFEKLQWLYKSFENQNFEGLSPMEIDFFQEVLERLAKATQDSESSATASTALNTQESILEKQLVKEEMPKDEEIHEDVTETSTEEIPIPKEEEKLSDTTEPSGHDEVIHESEIQEEINAQEVQSQTTTDATQHSEMPPHQPKNVIDQFANNSPSIADRAQKNIDDSTSHLLRRGGQISLNSLIDLNRRFLIINDVFGGKRMNFDKEIEQLNKMPNQDSAIEHLNHHVVKTYNVNTATKGFEILKKVVARRFES